MNTQIIPQIPLEGEVSPYLSDLSPKDKPWDKHASERDQVMQAYADRGHRYARRMSVCSQYLLYALKTVPDVEGFVYKLKNSWFCRVRHCPVCQWRREQKWRAQFFSILPTILEEHPTSRFLFLTLTVRNCDPLNLRETLAHMNKAWNKFVGYSKFPAYGWLRSTEVTKGKDGLAHPHFHALLMVGSSYFKHPSDYLKHDDWRLLWQKAARLDYEPMVNIKVVKPKLSAVGDDQGMFAAICETIKYSVKPADIVDDPDWLLMLTHELHKTRAVATGGILKEYLKELGQESDDDDLINVGEADEDVGEEVAKLFFNWKSDVKRYATRGNYV